MSANGEVAQPVVEELGPITVLMKAKMAEVVELCEEFTVPFQNTVQVFQEVGDSGSKPSKPGHAPVAHAFMY